MRVYLPATATTLRALLDSGELGGRGEFTAFGVTPALREWYVDDDAEALEYAALLEAARASLRLLDADPAAIRRRVVLAADVPDGDLTVRDDLDRAVVRVRAAVPMSAIASVHADDAEAEPIVAAAADSIMGADLGEVAAEETVTDAEGYELSWYANQEIGDFLDAL